MPSYNHKISQTRYLIYLSVLMVLANTTIAARAQSTTLPDFRDKQALVVGVGHYDHWPVLPNAVADAREMAFLLEHNGYEVTLLIDPDGDQLKESLSTLCPKTGKSVERSTIIFYAGQGESQKIAGCKMTGFILGRDCPHRQDDPDAFRGKAISTNQLIELSENMDAKQVLMVFDTSFAGDLFALAKPTLRLPGATSNVPIRQYIIAGGAHEPIPDHSIFSEYLIKGLAGDADAVSDVFISASELAVYLSQQMIRGGSGQHLQYGLHPDTALAGGDFLIQKLQRPKQTGRLYIDTQPPEARIRILNIPPKFKQGIDLEAGKYQLSVSAEGFRTQTKWVILPAGKAMSVEFILDATLPKLRNGLEMELRWIDSGSFYMGSKENGDYFVDNETSHTVRHTEGFYMQTTEVTVDQFSRFIKASKYRTDAEHTGCWVSTAGGHWALSKDVDWRHPADPNTPKGMAGNMPVICVSWNDAEAFTRWLSKLEGKSYRLPTESQWEYACRAGSRSTFAYGECLNFSQAHFAGTSPSFKRCGTSSSSQAAPMAVGQLKSNAWGLYDMHGNVAEWCRDWYAIYPDRMVRDPVGPDQGVEKVFRGGHYLSLSNECRASHRQSFAPDQATNVIGFRVVLIP